MSLAKDIGNVILKSERSVKFQAARLMLEVLHNRKLTKEEQKRLYNRVQNWKPEGLIK